MQYNGLLLLGKPLFLLNRYSEMQYIGLFVLLRHLFLPIQVSKWLGKQ